VTPPTDTTVSATTEPTAASEGESPTLAYSLLIGGGAGVALATIFGALANAKAKSIESASVFDPSVERSGKAYNTAAVVFGLAGVAAAGTGLYLLLTRDDGTESASTGSTRVASSGRSLSIFPAVGPGYAGAGAGFNF